MKKLLVALVAAFTLCFAMSPGTATAQESDQRWFVQSNIGPGVGNGALGMGGRIYLIGVGQDTGGFVLPVPTFEVWYRRGFLEMLDMEIRLNTSFITNWLDAGVRSKFFGDETFSLGARFDLTTLFFFVGGSDGSSAGALSFGVTPGLIASFGTKTLQASVAADFPLFLVAGAFVSSDSGDGSGSGSGFGAIFRPTVSVEFAVTDNVDMFIDVQALMLMDPFTFLLPMIGAGASW